MGYWIHTEFNYTSDIQDFKATLSQIEVAVKTFWGDIYKKMPKPEIGSVGVTFAESEVRHHDAYSHLLEILGLNEEFEKLDDNPVMRGRIRYLEDALNQTN